FSLVCRSKMLVWLVLLSCVWAVQGYGNGMVSASCSDMTPKHKSYVAQTSQAPFTITANNSTYTDAQEITGTLHYHTDSSAGCFSMICSSHSLPFIFNNTYVGSVVWFQSAAVSHTSAVLKSQIQSKWKAPASANSKSIEFRATVVQDVSTFWVGVKSSALSYTAPSGGSSTQSPSSSATVNTYIHSLTGCGSTKTCFSNPSDCDPSTDSSCYFMSSTPSGSQHRFEIVGPSSGYVAIGFSDDTEMGNDDIYICGKNSSGSIQLQHAFSTGTTTPTSIDLGSVSDISVSTLNGVISCSFTSANSISTTRSSSTGSSYYIFLAYGPTQNGCLMLIAWMTTGSVGMLIARYLKKTAKGTRCCGKDFWFVAHVFLMILSVAATIIAFILVFSYAKDWAGGAHPVLGVLVMILSLAQPIAALFRCGPQDERRYIFNWAHSINALAIKGLAVAAIFTGLFLVDTSDSQWLTKVMGGFVAWEAIFYLLQDFYQRWKLNGKIFRVLLLGFFFLGNLAFLVALLVGIGNA
uniref:Zgc:163022 n=1 Tax=Astyanax mexicanus TaxID=7994 RepID=W5KTA8_ASTMX